MSSWKKRTRSSKTSVSQEYSKKRIRSDLYRFQRDEEVNKVPDTQSALQLHAVREPYRVNESVAVPVLQDKTDLLVKVTAVGLNPIDWKAP